MNVRCVKELKTKALTFYVKDDKNEGTYVGSQINDNYWVVEAVGIETEMFNEHFEIVEEKK